MSVRIEAGEGIQLCRAVCGLTFDLQRIILHDDAGRSAFEQHIAALEKLITKK